MLGGAQHLEPGSSKKRLSTRPDILIADCGRLLQNEQARIGGACDRTDVDPLTAKSGQRRAGGQVVVYRNVQGGTGKTTTSLNLAVFAAHAGLAVCLVDLDSQRSLSRWHDRRPEQAPEIGLWAGRFTDVRQAIADIEARGDADLVVIDTPPSIDAHPAEVIALIRRAAPCHSADDRRHHRSRQRDRVDGLSKAGGNKVCVSR